MPLLFSYGTLQQEDVQWSTFGRLLEGQRDELPGFEPAVSVSHQHANVMFTGGADSRVAGTVFEISDAELAQADEYEERAKYTRIAVTLASGKQAWVYVEGSIAVRDAALADASAIASLVTQLGYSTAAAAMEPRLKRMLSLPHHVIVVAECSGDVVGIAGACVDHGVEMDTYGRITALAVDEKWRGRGVGKRLVQHVERWCRERGADRVSLTSGNHRPDSHKFYKALAYEATGIRFVKKL
jgi:GNAT superfamily N-acetyltransferase